MLRTLEILYSGHQNSFTGCFAVRKHNNHLISLGTVFGGLMKQDFRLSNIVVAESGKQIQETTLITILCESLFPIINGKGAAVTPDTEPKA